MTDEAAWLLNEKYQGVESPAFLADVARLNGGEPLAYLIGHIPFLNCQIYLDSKPLIPRPETEYWAGEAINTIRQAFLSNERFLRVLDLCAGSGAIGVAVAKALPNAAISFAELDPAHLPTIKKNLETNLPNATGLDEKYSVTKSDLFENVSGQFDFILSNPPYIDPALDRATDSVKNHEPHLALYGGADGMELIVRIIEEAPAHLKPEGQLWLEHEPEQVEALNNLAKGRFLVINHEDQYGIKRYSTLKLLSEKTVAK